MLSSIPRQRLPNSNYLNNYVLFSKHRLLQKESAEHYQVFFLHSRAFLIFFSSLIFVESCVFLSFEFDSSPETALCSSCFLICLVFYLLFLKGSSLSFLIDYNFAQINFDIYISFFQINEHLKLIIEDNLKAFLFGLSADRNLSLSILIHHNARLIIDFVTRNDDDCVYVINLLQILFLIDS